MMTRRDFREKAETMGWKKVIATTIYSSNLILFNYLSISGCKSEAVLVAHIFRGGAFNICVSLYWCVVM